MYFLFMMLLWMVFCCAQEDSHHAAYKVFVPGIVEVTVNQPLIAFKNALVLKRPVPKSLSALYRGYGIGVLNMAPTTALQIASADYAKNELNMSSLSASCSGGTISAFIATPTEATIVFQQMQKSSLKEAFPLLLREHGTKSLWRGLGATMARDAGFTIGFLSGAPWAEERLKKYQIPGAVLWGPLLAGVVTAVVTHPFDVIKTQQQGGVTTNVINTFNYIKNTQGYSGFMKGLTPRATRVVLAIIVMNKTKALLDAV